MVDSHYNKDIWYQWESIVQQYYEQKWFICKDKNFTIRWGEIDLVMEDSTNVVFIESKVVNYIDNLHDYITPKKLQTLKYAIDTYIWKFPTQKVVRIDIVFVQHQRVIEVFEDIEI